MLDAMGNAAGVILASMDGVAFATRQTFTATYEHVGACIYFVVDAFCLRFDLYTHKHMT